MNNQDLYFKNEASKYMFALTEVDGRIQLNLLGVNCSHYRYKNLAKNWYEYVKQTIENSEYTDLAEAMGILKVLYDEMITEIL
ncbi:MULTISPECIES: hypothetical protein [Fusobacterium]|uniref:Uncharacterized protein n=1 Tax=Fusobacterium animalis F0419 TaxID=999414 RepID=H1HEZ0_9FUSO|nr:MULTISPECIES: hypothetical protein [Fusobacterium]EHO78142.1 hypothetical protein HMPREF9942_01041 [Fusobacterium animalis F0419]ERT35056.1 hypothetical protein HMPREF1766_01531 [Fusobacterium nucleatum CTI-5]ERT42658.1 hypothetical protein HMPREF1538_00216 [Fusobacterium nucleatum CTI-1]